MLAGLFNLQLGIWDSMWEKILDALPNVGVGIVIFLAFWIAGVLAEKAVARLGAARRIDPDVMGLLARSAKIGFVLMGAISGLAKFGIDVSAMVAGLGLTGLALGLAMKEIISNALAGMQILVYKPFKRNDEITVQTFQGKVMEVNLRYTALDTAAGKTYVPNTILTTNAVIVSVKADDPPPAPPGAGGLHFKLW